MSNDNNAIVAGYGYWSKKVANEYLKLYESGLIDNIYIHEKDQRLLNIRDRRLKRVHNLNELPKEVRFAHVCTPNDTHFDVTKLLLEK